MRCILLVENAISQHWLTNEARLNKEVTSESAQAQQKDGLYSDSEQAESYFRRGYGQARSGAHEKAIEELRKAIRLSPGQERYRYELGVSLQALRELPAAAAVYRGCLDINPSMTDAWSNLGIVLSESGDTRGAISCFLQVVKLKPTCTEGYFNAGVCFASIWEHLKAVEHLSKAIALRPSLVAAHLWRGKSLYVMGDIRGAIESYQKVLQYNPAAAEAHWGISLANLMLGEYAIGWKEYEWRWKWDKFPSVRRKFSQPQWKGKPLKGRTILLHSEQGFGDTLQFVRYVPLVAEAGGRIILEVPSPLHELLQGYPGVGECVRERDSLPNFEVHCPLMSLPLIFGTTMECIPETSLSVSGCVMEPSKQLLSSDGLRVGLVWAGGRGHQWDRQRSLELKQFVSLWKVSDSVQFVSLQKGPASAQLSEAQESLAITDGVDTAKNFADTARVIAKLDLIITVDTAVAHLAGSMKKPVWILIPGTPDWRWGLKEETTPWYPTARLFRATNEGGWTGLMERVTKELKTLCGVR